MEAEPQAVAHLDPIEVAGYVRRTLADTHRSRVEAHLAGCEPCRDEVAEVARLTWTMPRPVRWQVPAAAAAAVALLALLSPLAIRQGGENQHRQATPAPATAPTAVGPRGSVDAVRVLIWTSVPQALSYRLRVFDAEGTIVFEAATRDTAIALPDSVRLTTRATYFWRVDAQLDAERWVPSELVDFTPARRPR